MTDTAPFYRYVRPTVFNEKRADVETNPYGGVCLRFEVCKESLWFVHARCAQNELFSKDVAKRVVDQRAKQAKESKYHEMGWCGWFPITKKTDELLAHVLHWSELWVPQVKEAGVLYHAFELKDLASTLRIIQFSNEQQEKLAENWKTSLAAANYGERYSNYGNP